MVKKRSVKKKVKKESVTSCNKIPVGVQIISILHYIGAGLSTLFGLMLILSAEYLSAIFSAELELVFASTFFTISGIVFIGLGILSFFIGRGLWKLRNWGRILAIIFMVLNIIYIILSMVSGFIAAQIMLLIIDLVIVGYLTFDKEVKKAFK